MELIVLSTGSRRRRSKKMALLRVRSGRTLLATSVTGEIIAKKASVSNIIKTETNMKACGLLTRNMDKELNGEWTVES